jgi:hypothetical protein
MFNIVVHAPSHVTKMVRCTNRGVVIWSTSLPKGSALHTLRAAAGIIYRAISECDRANVATHDGALAGQFDCGEYRPVTWPYRALRSGQSGIG